MKKFLKIFLILIVVILIILAIHTIRNFTVISNLQNNIKQYSSSTNYYLKTLTTQGNEIRSVEYSTKNGNQVVIQKRNIDGQETVVSMYAVDGKITKYTDTPTDKIVSYNSPSNISVSITNYFTDLSNNTMGKILMSLRLTIKSVNCNGKDCYVIKPLFEDFINEEYIEKSTGLTIKTVLDSEVVEKLYEFNNVKDEIFVQPDVSQYSVEKES